MQLRVLSITAHHLLSFPNTVQDASCTLQRIGVRAARTFRCGAGSRARIRRCHEKTIALNRRARHEFTIDETFEAGIVLTGTEIKSIRAGKVNLADAYARIERDEAWLIGAHIAPFEQANRYNHEPKREPEAPPPPLRDRRAARPDEGEGPDDRAAPAVPEPARAGRSSSWRSPAASSSTTAAATSPIATPGATSPASSPTRSAAAERQACP